MGHDVLKLLFFFACRGGICVPDTCAMGVAPSLDSLALIVLQSMQRCLDATVSKHYIKTKHNIKSYGEGLEAPHAVIPSLIMHANGPVVRSWQ